MTPLNRRDFMLTCGAGALAAGLPGTARAGAKKVLPNIVYILADDMGYGDLACQNRESKIPTPNLDRLAKQGVRFTDAHSPSAVCTPTRYGILTGRYCWRSRLKRSVLGSWGRPLIEEGRLTVPELLHRRGYRTACIGKWHLGFTWPTRNGKAPKSGPDRLSNVDFERPVADGPTTRGFDAYFGVDVPNYPPYCFINTDRTVGIPSVPNRPEFNRPGPMLPDWQWVDIMPELTRRAEAYVTEAGKTPAQPFFLYFPLTAPHFPVVPAPDFKGKSGAGNYGDYVVQVDWTVGRVLDALERSGQSDNTLVIFTSDNGPEITGEVKPGAYDRVREYGHASMGALRGAKRDAWEGGHRVPFLARWPGTTKAGSVCDETICLTDLMATVAAMLGVALPEDAGEDSCNILPALAGVKHAGPLREATVYHSCNGKFALRKGGWVFIDAPSGGDNREPEWWQEKRGYVAHDLPGELYDLAADPAEHRNLYAERPEIAAELRALLEKYKREGRSVPRTRG